MTKYDPVHGPGPYIGLSLCNSATVTGMCAVSKNQSINIKPHKFDQMLAAPVVNWHVSARRVECSARGSARCLNMTMNAQCHIASRCVHKERTWKEMS